jgi:hypothetical protein
MRILQMVFFDNPWLTDLSKNRLPIAYKYLQ